MTSLVNSLTSFFSGFVIFTYLGYMAKYQDREIDKVAEQGIATSIKSNYPCNYNNSVSIFLIGFY